VTTLVHLKAFSEVFLPKRLLNLHLLGRLDNNWRKKFLGWNLKKRNFQFIVFVAMDRMENKIYSFCCDG
jgi:hypothetical protein